MNLETRLTNLENLVEGLIKNINNKQYYTDADISSVRNTSSNLSATKADITTISTTTESIGSPSSQTYEVDDVFMADGQMYKAVAKIYTGNILVENGNCEQTTINNELAKLKEEE